MQVIKATPRYCGFTRLNLSYLAGALPRDTTAKLNDLMDKRHVADYRPHIPIGTDDLNVFRPWIVGFVREVLKLLGKSAPVEDAGALQRAVGDFDKIRLE